MSEKSLVLAIETAKNNWSVSLLRGEQELLSRTGNNSVSSSEILIREISLLLEENKVSLNDLAAIAVSRGPGSFTGIRVGLTTAQALAFGAKIKCYGVTLFEAMALRSSKDVEGDKILTAISAGQDQIYWQLFSFHNNQFHGDFSSRLDDSTVFVANVHKQEKENRKVKILSDIDLTDLLENSETSITPTSSSKISKMQFQIVQFASDNLAKYIGLKCQELMMFEYQGSAKQTNLKPLYLREVRIGK